MTTPADQPGSTRAPRNIHIVSAGYLRRFGVDGHVMVHDVATGESKRRGVRAVARRRDWWGTEPGLSEVVETSFNQCESPALRSLRALDKDWALTAESRALLAQFIAIHVVRTPAFGTFVRGTTEAAIDDFRDRGTIAPESFDGAADLFRRPRMHANTLLGQITRIASLFCSMQWVLVRFNEDLLITSDQPVVALPCMPPGRQANAAAVPPTGWVDTVEIRFPLDPKTLLLMTWSDDEDPPAPLDGGFNQACNINASLSQQADKEWFFRPDTFPHRLAPPLLRPLVLPISSELLGRYTAVDARGSKRRGAANELIEQILRENGPRDVVRWVTATRKRHADAGQ
jgi:hypothetical protein